MYIQPAYCGQELGKEESFCIQSPFCVVQVSCVLLIETGTVILLFICNWLLALTQILFFIMDPWHQKATYMKQSFKWSTSPPLEHLYCIRCGNKCKSLLPACRLNDRRCHLHLCHLLLRLEFHAGTCNLLVS